MSNDAFVYLGVLLAILFAIWQPRIAGVILFIILVVAIACVLGVFEIVLIGSIISWLSGRGKK